MLAAVGVAVAVGFGVVAPAIPEFARSFGVGKTAAGAVISAFALMRFVSALGGGRLVDAFGERLILATGIGIVAVSTGLAGLSQSYEQLLVLRGIGGIGSAMFTVSATALLFRVVGPKSRGRANGLFQSGFLVGGLLGPLVGGFLTSYSLRLPFYVYAVSLVGAGAIASLQLSATRLRPAPRSESDAAPVLPAPVEGASVPPVLADAPSVPPVPADAATVDVTAADEPPATPLREALAHPSYRAAIAVNFAIGWAFFGVRISLIPLFVTEALHASVIWIGIGFLCTSVAEVCLLLVAGRFVDRVGRRPALVTGCLVVGLALTSLAFDTRLPAFLVTMTALGAGGAFVSTAPGAIVGDLMRGRGGKVVAVFQMSADGGTITGPLAAGWLADQISFRAAFVACALVVFAAMVLAVRMPETLAGAPARHRLLPARARRRTPT
ncbi:MAG: transporter, family, multidrug resistance protein [Nocardioidaceae bacterium]|nr:transporter, family, multidrug resistance protein [Nocardioidaceae bacterium]